MEHSLKVRNNGMRREIFDNVRRRWIARTPEEEVRQKIILYLLNVKKIPLSHISVEHGIDVNGMTKRYDILVFDNTLSPHMIVECKAPTVKLTQKVLEQAGRYNNTLHAPFLCVTNGIETLLFKIDFKTATIEPVQDF